MGLIRSLLSAVLVAMVVLQGVITAAPHRHDPATIVIDTTVTDHWCGHHTNEAFPASKIYLDTQCLACAVAAPVIGQNERVTLAAAAARPAGPAPADAIAHHPRPHRLHSPRGPPHFA